MAQLNSVLTASAARTNFYQLLASAIDNLAQYKVNIRGKGNAVIMSEEEFEGWKETLEITSDQKLMKKIKAAEKSQKTYTHQQVKDMLGL